MANDREDDAVGYKRPPRHSQFMPGRSGNPHGRRKNVQNFKTDLLDELREQIPIRENGRERRISKQRAFIKALVAAAIKGDMRATNALVSFCTRSLGGQYPTKMSTRLPQPMTSTLSKPSSHVSASEGVLRKQTKNLNERKRR